MAEVLLSVSLDDPGEQKKLIAVKKLLPRVVADRSVVQHLIDEAKVCALLSHPNIVQVFDLGVAGQDVFLAMEFVNGKSLDRVLDRLRKSRTPFPREALLYLVRQVAEGLTYAHQATDSANRSLDVVHRDVTPGNILIGYDGTVKLTDFGIATAEQWAGASANVALGKLPYMAPEQLRGGTVDRRADIYSLAALLYEAVTLTLPFESSTAVELQQKILRTDPKFDRPEFASEPDLVDVLRQCLQKDPNARPRTATFIAERLASPASIDVQTGKVALALLLTEHFSREREEEIRRREDVLSHVGKEDEPPAAPIADLSDPDQGAEKTEWRYTDALDEMTRFSPNPMVVPPPESRQEIGRIDLAQISVPKAKERVLPIIEIPSEPERTLVSDSPLPREPSIPPVNPIIIPRLSSSPKAAPPGVIRSVQNFNFKENWTLIRKFALPAVLIFFGIWFLSTVIRWWNRPTSIALGVIRQVSVYVTIEKGVRDEDMKEMSRWVLPNSREELWLRPLTRFFAREFRRNTGKNEIPLTFRHGDPRLEVSPINWTGTFFSPSRPFVFLDEMFALQKFKLTPGNARLFVHVYSKKAEEAPRYPLDYLGERPSGEGIVFLPLNKKDDPESLIRLAHELGHMLGAREKYDRRGLAIFPQGYVRPKQDPLYPQPAAELMTRGIPLSALTQKPIPNLDQVQIGPASATEMGWISPGKSP